MDGSPNYLRISSSDGGSVQTLFILDHPQVDLSGKLDFSDFSSLWDDLLLCKVCIIYYGKAILLLYSCTVNIGRVISSR